MINKIYDNFLVIPALAGIIYFILLWVRDIIKKVYRKFRVKEIRVTNANMTVTNKYFTKGKTFSSGYKVPSALPDAYFIELEYRGRAYRINDKDIFETANVGDSIIIRLIEKLDKYENLISYKLEGIK